MSIALKAAAHYDVCLKAKIAQLDHVFAAKVGWLTGNLYSRVATPDVEEKIDDFENYKSAYGEEALHGYTAWLTSMQFKALKKTVAQWRRANLQADLTMEVATELLKTVPEDVEFIANRAVDVLRDLGLLPNDQDTLKKARNSLRSDTNLQRLIRTFSA